MADEQINQSTEVEVPAPQQVPIAPQAPAPVVQQAVPQQPGQSVQYIVAQKSLQGVGGWLVGWIIWLALNAFSAIWVFFGLLESGTDGTAGTLSLVFAPIIAVLSIAAIVTITQQKLLGKQASLAFIGTNGLYALLLVIAGDLDSSAAIAGSIAGIGLVCGLQALYFFQSERVKQTLIK